MLGMKKQKGMTLLEIIIALGIIGVVSAGVVVLAQRAIDAQNMTKVTQSANAIQIAMTQTYRGLGSYPTDATTSAEGQRVSQSLLRLGRVAEDDIRNPFTGNIVPVMTFGRATEVDNKAFGIAYEGLTLDQCRQLVTNTIEMFPYIQVTAEAVAPKPTGPFMTEGSAGINGVGVIKSPSGVATNFNMTDLRHVENLCGNDEGAFFSVTLGNS